MPDEKGILTEEEVKKAINTINEKYKENIKICLVCKEKEWVICDQLFSYGTFLPQKGLSLMGNLLPLIILICKNCGHTMSFSARKLEIIP